MIKSKRFMLLTGLSVAGMIAAACAPQTVIQTQVVEVTTAPEIQEVVQTQVVEVTTVVEAASFTTPHPVLGDVRVRQAIAYCTNRPELIASVYPFLTEEEQQKLLMDTNITKDSWASYDGPDLQKYPFDVEKGGALLDEAGWTLADGADFRANAAGDELNLKFTTTSASFRQTWAAVFEQQMAACGIRILRLHAPASWWFGSTTGLRHRDFELGAYAWVGESDPKGQTLYACNQIPLPENGWAGQNYMGWCNQTASDAINAANNTLDRNERIAQYKIFQIEFAKDMVSLPVFQRVEADAATTRLVNFKPSPTDYFTWNADEWELSDGGDTLVMAQSQEPASMFSIIESSASQRYPAYLVFGAATNQNNYDYQPAQAQLSTLENGLMVINKVDVKEGDPVVDSNGTPTDPDGNLLTLKAGLKVKDADGNEVEFSSGTVSMNQLVVTYKFDPKLTWSDGTPVTKADFELGYKIDCDPATGVVDLSSCQSIQSVDFTADTEYVVTYKPGFAAPLAINPLGFGYYPAHQVLSDGRKLADVPAAEWSSLKEIAETPLGTGPYVLVNWEKGVKMEFEANANYYKGEPKIKKITILFIQDTQQAVAQLLTGEVDTLDKSTLGAGAELQSVLDAEKEGKPIKAFLQASPTWEHIDMNMFIP